MSAVRSRPSSARYPTDKPVPVPRRGSVSENENFLYDCKAAYLTVLEDLTTEIESKQELCEVLQQAGRSPTSKTLAKYWRKNTESLTFEDFCDICRKEPATTEDDLIRAFRRVDINGDGYISNSELRKMLTTKGDRMTAEEVQKIIDEVDENGDGKLDYREFAKMIIKTQQECKQLAHKSFEKKQTTSSKFQASPRSSRNETMGKTAIKGGPDVREWSRAGISKQLILIKPRTLRDWKMTKNKGFFIFNEKGKIISHQYLLKVPQDSVVWITIEPYSISQGDLNNKCEVAGCPVDIVVFILDADNELVAFSDQRDVKGKFAVSCELKKGSYKLLPFTTGCRFIQRTSEPSQTAELVTKKSKGQLALTKEFKNALRKIFDMNDLSCNDSWSREEFRLFNWLVSGQELSEEEWQVVEEKIEMSNGNITMQGYLQLTQMEADDLGDGDDEDLWVTLSSMGFNNSLCLDEASPFMLEVYAEKCAPSLRATAIEEGGRVMQAAVTAMVKRKGEESRVRGSNDLFLHSLVTDFRFSLVIENRSSSKQRVVIDCRKSENVCSHQASGLTCAVDVPSKSSVVALHLLPKKDTQCWSVACVESVK